MNPELVGLRDIHGLDSVPWWPLAPGWWVLLLTVVLLSYGLWLIWRWWSFDWRAEARLELNRLKQQLRTGDLKRTAGSLSELLRRIAIARTSRQQCAGLTGLAWLQWLRTHDPKGFDWEQHGRLLMELPYAPARSGIQAQRVSVLITATAAWIESAEIKKKRSKWFQKKPFRSAS